MANLVARMKRGDSKPAFRAQLIDEATTPATIVDLTAASQAKLLMRKPDGTLFNQALTVENQTTNTGWVNRTWGGTDLDIAGNYDFEIEITWNDGKIQTFPANQYGTIVVAQDLG